MRNFGVTDYENVSGIDDMGMSRLAQRYASAVSKRKAEDYRREFETDISAYMPHLEVARKKLVAQLEYDSENVSGHLPVTSVYDALQIVKAADVNVGTRALTSHLETLWKKDRTASISANTFCNLKDHYTRNYPKAGMGEVFDRIASKGYLALPMSDLMRIASEIESQEDFDLAMMRYGLDGRQPHQVKARKFVLAVLNGESSNWKYLDAWMTSPRGAQVPWNREYYLEDGHFKERDVLNGYTLAVVSNDSFGGGEEHFDNPTVGDLPEFNEVKPRAGEEDEVQEDRPF